MDIQIIDLDDKSKYKIDLTKTSGEQRFKCPKCTHARKNQKDKALAWNIAKETGFCHHCNASFVAYKEFKPQVYKKPQFTNDTELSDKAIKWFEKRAISQSTLNEWNVTEGLEWMPQTGKQENTIQFNYFRDGELINIKYRDGRKNFKFVSEAELIPYGLDILSSTEEIIIVEGEIDALTFYEAGFKSVISVPNGAKASNNNLTYLDSCIDIFDKYNKIIIATDNDLPGVGLRNDLATRLGIEKCYKISFKDCKDANEYAVKYGVGMLIDVIENKESFPIEGVFSSNDIDGELDNMYKFGLQKGLTIDDLEIDKYISFETGRLYTITGIPGHGKSELVDYIITKLNVLHGWKSGIFSPENHPLQLHMAKIFSKITGKSFDQNHLNYNDYLECKHYVSNNFYFISPPNDFTVDTILSKARQLVYQKGVKILVIDPYNKLEHKQPNNISETNYISLFLDKLTNFAKLNNIIVFLVAHPRKMGKDKSGLPEVPTLYDINGSANFYNKTDFGICVYRNFQTKQIEIYFQKIKFKHLGEVGNCDKMYNYINGRFEDLDKDINGWDYSNYLHPKPIDDKFEDLSNDGIMPNMDFDNTNPDPF